MAFPSITIECPDGIPTLGVIMGTTGKSLQDTGGEPITA